MTGSNVLGSGRSSNNIGIGRVNNNNIENLIVKERCNNNQVSRSDSTKESKSSRKRKLGNVGQPDSTPTTAVRKSRRNIKLNLQYETMK